jgi:hypothetical protein
MIKNRTDFIMGIGYVYYDDKGRRYVFDNKREMDQFIQELKNKPKKKNDYEKKRVANFQPQIELLHRKGIGI